MPRPTLVLMTGGADAPRTAPGRPLLVSVLAARPDAVTLAPVTAGTAVDRAFRQVVVSTGEPSEAEGIYDVLAALGRPAPDYELATGTGSHAERTAIAARDAEQLLSLLDPAVMMVTGAADSTLGWALSAVKLGIPVARVEAGLREHDWTVPAEVNRVLLDTMADCLFAPSEEAARNLERGGAGEARIHVAGSTAVDAVRRLALRARRRAVWRSLGLDQRGYVLVTLHRPSNVDDDERLARIVEGLAELAQRTPVVFPVHTRTASKLALMGDAYRLEAAGVRCLRPLSYLDFISMQIGAGAVVTDSGTVQEEASGLGIACFTLGSVTERTATVTHGTNRLIGDDARDLAAVPIDGGPARCEVPLWDGHAGERVASALVANYALVRATGV